MKIRYLEFKDQIDRIYDREIKDIKEGIHHEWIEFGGPCYDKVLEGDTWDEDFLKDYRIEGDRMIRI